MRMAPRMLIVDEVHHLLVGSHREQRASLNLLKYLANELKMSIVAVGTSDAPVAFQTMLRSTAALRLSRSRAGPSRRTFVGC